MNNTEKPHTLDTKDTIRRQKKKQKTINKKTTQHRKIKRSPPKTGVNPVAREV